MGAVVKAEEEFLFPGFDFMSRILQSKTACFSLPTHLFLPQATGVSYLNGNLRRKTCVFYSAFLSFLFRSIKDSKIKNISNKNYPFEYDAIFQISPIFIISILIALKSGIWHQRRKHGTYSQIMYNLRIGSSFQDFFIRSLHISICMYTRI